MNDMLENLAQVETFDQGLSFRENKRFGGISCRITTEKAMDRLSMASSSLLSRITSLSFSGIGHEHITAWLSPRFIGLRELSVTGAGLSARGSAWSHGCNVIQMTMENSDDFFNHITNYKNLRVLRLANNRLSNRGLSYLRGLDNLEGMDLSGNEISSLASLSGFSSLKRLNLSNNKITGVGIGGLENLHNLETLNLSGNPLSTNFGYNDSGHLSKQTPKLVNLSVANCGLASVEFLSAHQSLQKLVVSRNPNMIGLGKAVDRLNYLYSLEAVGVTLSDDCAGYLSAKRTLVKLDLRRTVGALGVVNSIGSLLRLNTLRIDGVDAEQAANIANLGCLERLTLNNGGMGNGGAAKISQLSGLTHLSLSNQQLDDGAVSHLAKLKRLRSLNLSHNALRGMTIGQLSGLRGLAKLTLISNPLEIRDAQGFKGTVRILY